MELPMGEYNDSEVKYSREFTAEETSTQPSKVDFIVDIASKLVLREEYYTLILWSKTD